MRRQLAVAALVVVVIISSAAYAWTEYQSSPADDEQEQSGVVRFKTVVNGAKSLDVCVSVNISDGLTRKEAELIVGTAFIQVMGECVMHRLDTLTFDDARIDAHYTWGYDENDMGHIFDISVDLVALEIRVDHCH